MNPDCSLKQFVQSISAALHFKPGIGEPVEDVTIGNAEIPKSLIWLFRNMEAASPGSWQYCSFRNSFRAKEEMNLVRDEVGLDAVDANSVSPEIMQVYWSNLWIPVFVTEHNSICVDLNPAAVGLLGQIIRVSDDSEERRLVCQSLHELCERVVRIHKLGQLHYVDNGAGNELQEAQDSLLFLWGADACAA